MSASDTNETNPFVAFLQTLRLSLRSLRMPSDADRSGGPVEPSLPSGGDTAAEPDAPGGLARPCSAEEETLMRRRAKHRVYYRDNRAAILAKRKAAYWSDRDVG